MKVRACETLFNVVRTNQRHFGTIAAGLIALGLTAPLLGAAPLGTAFTYQGHLADGGGLATGLYDFRFTLFDAGSGGVPVGSPNVVTADGTAVSNGLFVVRLDFGPAFSGQARWLGVEVKTNQAASYVPLNPRTELTATPEAHHALRAASAEAVAPGAVTSAGLATAAVTAASIADGTIGPAELTPALANSTFWKLGGNAGGGNFLGSVDNQPVEIRANNQASLRLLPGASSPNLLGGHAANAITPGSSGAVVGGGGSAVSPNTVDGDYAAVGGGHGNSVVGRGAFVGGGSTNRATATAALVGGGALNRATDDYATVPGGKNNHANAIYSVVGGGEFNSADRPHAVIAGGFGNEAMGDAAVVGGGYANLNIGDRSVLGGGEYNTVTNDYAVASGGLSNIVGAVGAAIGGGGFNTNVSSYGIVGGGFGNYSGGYNSVIGGGASNLIVSSVGTTIGGGRGNIGQSFDTTIAGGFRNFMALGADYSSIGGGIRNAIVREAVAPTGATIAGGTTNRVQDSPYATIGGGINNRIDNGSAGASVVGGGQNLIDGGSYWATIAGGWQNQALGAEYGAVGGGFSNYITGAYATIPGGTLNSAVGGFSMAAGRRAKANHTGSFVWADSTDADFASTSAAQFAVRANNGVVIQSTNIALELRGGGKLRVPGAGVNTDTPIFTHRATGANTSGSETRISHPHCDGKPTAILMVTYNFNPAGLPGTRNDRAVGIYYNGSQWAIYNLDAAPMPIGAAYNILVANP